jgi:lysophospholipase L1-like esterase
MRLLAAIISVCLALGASAANLAYVVLGDSTAAGQGAPYDQGIAVLTTANLAKSRSITMTNLAVSGAKTEDVLSTQLPAAVRLRPDLVLLAVGANDVTHLTSIRSVRRSLREIIRGLRAANANVAIVLTGSPDMGAPPRVLWALRPIAAWRTRGVNRMIESLARDEKVVFAPIAAETGPLFRSDRSLFAADLFHPNARGYATWLPALNRGLEQALAGSP